MNHLEGEVERGERGQRGEISDTGVTYNSRDGRELVDPTLIELDQLLSLGEQSSLNDRLNSSVNEKEEERARRGRSNESLINVTETSNGSWPVGSRVHRQSISSTYSSCTLSSTYNLIKRKRGVSSIDTRAVNSVSIPIKDTLTCSTSCNTLHTDKQVILLEVNKYTDSFASCIMKVHCTQGFSLQSPVHFVTSSG